MRSFDVGLGAAHRIALGELDDDPMRDEHRGGPAPIMVARTGLSEVIDIGLGATAAGGRGEFRAAWTLDEEGEFRAGFGVFPSFLSIPGGGGERFGLELAPMLTFGAGLYEASFAGRLRIEALGAGGVMYAAGAAIGLAVGFRPIHGVIELTAEYETWPDASGLVLTPAFALRYRF